ncbi:hypothetical protein CEUSTIGMA_g4054.t1 [Chlamydomonas eustigma]|uniref:Methyltransferase small domain-containing protein n=1 Tax=Chlamydomonas eustigma TaxID=1157962 RepID=A0A250X0K5_9CHLO|nr:hypothetical protein CEUSTIGMA_g4054.t1 [Chlamydomonas eustigma]|eukprot:GAX76608.1 hypothetical protein CEUSTIGMA_g4054.t1 [Chlamydomonas eustigma]
MVLEIIEKLKVSSKASNATQDFIEFDDGTMLWNASLVLLNYICEHEDSLKGKRVLELGSGLGHLAVGLCRVGALVTCTERPKELIDLTASVQKQLSDVRLKLEQQMTAPETCTASSIRIHSKNYDCPSDQETSQHLASSSTSCSMGSVDAVALEWGEEAFCRSPLAREEVAPFDAIILAEVVYNTSYHQDLLWTIQKFSHPDIVIYSVMVDRPFSFMFFAQLHDLGLYDVEPITEYDSLGMDKNMVHMHRITMKKK